MTFLLNLLFYDCETKKEFEKRTMDRKGFNYSLIIAK